VIINYAAPADGSATASSDTVDPALQREFDAARAAFKSGDYDTALAKLDGVIKALPSDPVAHEMRALTLFAMGRYDDAAAGLNSLLAVAPGWNWETMRDMYPDVATYTKQLRTLEAFAAAHPTEPAPQFVLAYHYLVTNYTDAAKKKLQKVLELQPKDRVAQQLLKGLEDKAPPEVAPEAAAPSDAETDLSGSWSATKDDASFKLTLDDGGNFTWTAPFGKEEKKLTGKYTLAGNTLVLEEEGGDTLVGKVTAVGANKFHFRFVGGPGDDPGLDFERSGVEVAKPPVEPKPAPEVRPAPEDKPAAEEEGREF